VTTTPSVTEQVLDASNALVARNAAPFPLPINGLEALVAGTVSALSTEDWWVPGLRERAGAVLRGVPLTRLMDGFAGARPYRVAPPIAAPALRALTAVGLALGADAVAVVHLGAGALADGAFTEALNLAALEGARVVFVVAMPTLSDNAPVGPQSATTPSRLAVAYGLPCRCVDGLDVDAVRDAVQSARNAQTASVIEARV